MQKIVKKCAYAPSIVLLIVAFLLFSGCVTLEIRQKISPDGTASGSMNARADLNSLYISLNITPDQYALVDAKMKESLCNASEFEAQNLTNVKCDVANAVLTLSADVKPGKLNETVFSKKPGLIYTEYWYTPSAEEPGKGLLPEQLQQVQSLKSLGANVTLIFEMPGSVFETNGKIVGGTVVFDILDLLAKGTSPYIKSRELNLIVVGGIVVVVLILIAGAALLLRKPAANA